MIVWAIKKEDKFMNRFDGFGELGHMTLFFYTENGSYGATEIINFKAKQKGKEYVEKCKPVKVEIKEINE